jgi:hypothetical protein
MDLLERHHWSARLRVVAIRGRIERHEDLLARHLEMGDSDDMAEVAARIEVLKDELVHAEAIRTAVDRCMARRQSRLGRTVACSSRHDPWLSPHERGRPLEPGRSVAERLVCVG